MQDEYRWYPYPNDPARKIGFIIADVFCAGLFVMFIIMLFPTLTR